MIRVLVTAGRFPGTVFQDSCVGSYPLLFYMCSCLHVVSPCIWWWSAAVCLDFLDLCVCCVAFLGPSSILCVLKLFSSMFFTVCLGFLFSSMFFTVCSGF